MKLQTPVPIFRIFDYELAKKFYIDWLGFRIDWEHRFSPSAPRYLQIARDAAVLHLSEHHGDCCPGAKASINLDDVEAFQRELSSRPNPYMNPGIEDAPWNARCLQVTDPFGNRLSFNQPH